jgi:hypothetical protein
MKSKTPKGWMRAVVSGILLAAAMTSTGCQVSMSGQTLPSPYYYLDDVQYFAPGPEMKLTNEANMMKAYNAERELQQR